MIKVSAKKILLWRKKELAKGGRSIDLDWLLDLEGGLSWSTIQRIHLDSSVLIEMDKPLSHLEEFWQKHIENQVPLQYLVGRCPWRDVELEVNPAVLIPRQETELLIDLAMQKFDEQSLGRWADLGTGSGALAVALSRSLPGWEGHGVDCSKEALDVARKNLSLFAPKAKCRLHLGDWWEPLKSWWGNFNLVLANPPYVPEYCLNKLDPLVRKHEPYLALSGGVDGLKSCRKVIEGAVYGLAPGGVLMLEHHHDQSSKVLELMKQVGLVMVEHANDLQQIRRFAIGTNPF